MAEKTEPQVVQVEPSSFDTTWREEKWDGKQRTLADSAQSNSRDEKDLTVAEAIQRYKPGIFWCLVVSMCVIMEGYDTNLINNFFAYPAFQRKYGRFVGVSEQTPSGYQLTGAWQAGVSQAASVGAFFGVLLNGYLVNIFGQKKVLIGALICLSGFIFIPFFAQNLPTLVVGQVFCGFPWGVFATTAPAYASEVLPTALRTYFTSWTNMCFIIGQLISAGILQGFSSREDDWAFRIPFAIQWTWPIFLIPTIYFAPESPWYLVRQGRIEEAEASLRRLQSQDCDIDAKKTLATIIYTNNLEEQLSVGTSYWDCFKGFELRRTEIACVCFAGQILSGICFAYNSSYFFLSVGLGTDATYKLALGGTALALLGTFVNWFALMPYFGRRTIYVSGMVAMTTILMLIGVLNVWTDRPGIGMTQACLTLVWTFIFQLSAGQLGWALPAEIGSTRLRQKTICLARNALSLVGLIGGILQPYFMNPEEWNLRGYTGFVWGSTALLTAIWAYFRLPETWKRSYHELDILFAKRISARHFASTKVDVFDEAGNDQLAEEYAATANRRPSIVPSITQRIGHDAAYNAQRRVSLGTEQRRPSIQAAVTDYAAKQNDSQV